MDKKNEEFESFEVIEDPKNKVLKKNKVQNLKSSSNKKEDKIKLSKNGVLIYDEKSKTNKIIIDDYPKEEIENSFLKKNDFCIISNFLDKIENKKEKIKLNLNDSLENNLAQSKLIIFEEAKLPLKRSDSFNADSRSSTKKIIRNIQKNNNKEIDLTGFEDLIKENLEKFKADCILYDKKNNSFNGTLDVDEKYKCIFSIKENKEKIYYNDEYYTFSLLEIKNYNKNQNYYSGKENLVEINLKDNRYFLFKFPNNNNYNEFIEILSLFAFPDNSDAFFKNAYTRYNILKKKKFDINGWEIYNFDKEFKRQKVDFKNIYNIVDNSDFRFCSSYPIKIITPKMPLQDLKKCASFRTKNRIPTLTYRHKNGFCIWRSSQTQSGFMGKSKKDIEFLTKISEASKKLIVYDARPKLNAMANKLKGAGYENTNNYPNIKMEIVFCGIPNIHSVRTSYEKMFTNISYNNDNEYSVIANLPSTSWYETIILILKSGFQIYNSINDKWTVLIHCSDGWDRTAQLSCISQLLLDKYYRTLEGFICLIEKDWLSFGHQFRYRNGFYSSSDPNDKNAAKENQFSPIFLQWLDCVYQLMCQNYTKFEFNLNLLTVLASEIYCGKFGTFLFNNEEERVNNNAKTKTISIWSMIIKEKKKYLNPIYDPNNNENININYKKIKLWTEYFYRFEKGESKKNYIRQFTLKMYNYEKKINKTENIIKDLTKFIMDKSLDISSLSEECRNEMGKYCEQNDSKINSFIVLEPTKSILEMNNNYKK